MRLVAVFRSTQPSAATCFNAQLINSGTRCAQRDLLSNPASSLNPKKGRTPREPFHLVCGTRSAHSLAPHAWATLGTVPCCCDERWRRSARSRARLSVLRGSVAPPLAVVNAGKRIGAAHSTDAVRRRVAGAAEQRRQPRRRLSYAAFVQLKRCKHGYREGSARCERPGARQLNEARGGLAACVAVAPWRVT